jgi:hypothetical protein
MAATPLAAALPLAASVAAARCAASSEAPRPVAAAAQPLRRRVALGAALGAALLAAAPREALAYGGSGNIRSTDEGSGNPRYDDLVATMKLRGAVPEKMPDADAGKKGKCTTGREPACK